MTSVDLSCLLQNLNMRDYCKDSGQNIVLWKWHTQVNIIYKWIKHEYIGIIISHFDCKNSFIAIVRKKNAYAAVFCTFS